MRNYTAFMAILGKIATISPFPSELLYLMMNIGGKRPKIGG